MPDLISHVLIALLLCELLNLKPKSLIILGAVLPDLLMKWELLHLFFPFGDRLFWFFVSFHTPFSLLFSTFIVIQFFNYDKKKSYLLVTIGWISHLAADLIFNRHFHTGSLLLLPFSWQTYEVGLAWPEEYYLVLVPLIIIYVGVKIIKYSYPQK